MNKYLISTVLILNLSYYTLSYWKSVTAPTHVWDEIVNHEQDVVDIVTLETTSATFLNQH